MENKMIFSEQAYLDGFDFSMLPVEEQKLTRDLYKSSQAMSDLYMAICIYDDLVEQGFVPGLEGRFDFPESGNYRGIVLHCTRSRKRSSDFYFLHLLCSETELYFIPFRLMESDPVYAAIRRTLNITPEVRAFDLHDCIGQLLAVQVSNETQQSGRTFSAVVLAQFASPLEEQTLYDMLNIMLFQHDSEEESGGRNDE